MKETVGLAMICNRASPSLAQALESVVPHVDQAVLVATTTDPDALAALQAMCADHKVECYHLSNTSILDDKNGLLDFSKARNESFAHLTTDWAFWCDADDVVENASHLRRLAEAAAAQSCDGYWFPYFYAFDEFGNVNTMHSRERLLRRSAGWTWEHRIHEVCMPSHPVHWLKSADVVVHHAREQHSQAERNFRLLKLMLDEKPDEPRTWMHLGMQHFAVGDWPHAVQWYYKFYSDPRCLPLQRWEAMTYAARAYRQMGDYDQAIKADNAALLFAPHLGDAYLGLAESYLRRGSPEDYEKAIVWAKGALERDMADDLAMVNPLDHLFQPWNVLSLAYAGLGRVDDAIEACERALEVRPADKSVLKNKAIFEAGRARKAAVDAYEALAPALSDSDRIRVARGIAGPFLHEQEVRDHWVPSQLRLIRKRGTQPEVVIFCGPSAMRRWAAPTPETEGIGGSETAVVEIAKRLANDGWRVLVYNQPEDLEGWYDGVAYLDWRRYRPTDASDLTVAWRRPDWTATGRTWLWLHDLNYGPQPDTFGAGAERVFGVSSFHARYLEKTYPSLQGVGTLPNGVNMERFSPAKPVERQRFKCVYFSSPDRGLLNLLRLWPGFLATEPTAELHIYYGWDNIDRVIAMGNRSMADFKAQVVALTKQKGVFWRGNLPQKDLTRELLTADLWLYPTGFLETFCIAAVEAMAAGLYPITSKAGALPEVIGDVVPLVPGISGSYSYNKTYLGLAFAFLQHLSIRAKHFGKGQERAKLWTWNNTYEQHWKPALKEAVRV